MSLVGKSITGLFQLMGLTVITHAVTFFMTTMLISRVETSLYGFATVQLQLLISTILFLSREAFRNACQRSAERGKAVTQEGEGRKEWERRIINLNWLVLPVGIVMTTLGCIASFSFASAEERSLQHYQTAVLITALAALIELASEPLYVMTLRYLLFKPRACIEVIAALVRCFSSVYFVYFHPEMGALAFSYSWLLNGCAVTGGYYLYFLYLVRQRKKEEGQRKKNEKKEKTETKEDKKEQQNTEFPLTSFRELFPRKSPAGSWFDQDAWDLLKHFFWQSCQMYVLTEGQKYVLKGTQSLTNQALFSIVNNLGSLVARFIFGPVEQISNSLLSKYSILGPKKAAEILTVLLKFMILFGITFLSYGPNYSFLLLDMLYGARISRTDAPSLLAFYCGYVLVMAVNGIAEAFLRAVAKPHDLTMYNWFLIVFSAIYLGACILFTQLFNTLGLIFADSLNLSLRIAYCLYFIVSFFKENNSSRKGKEKEGEDPDNFTYFHLSDCLPSKVVGLSYVAAVVVIYLTGQIIMPTTAIHTQGYTFVQAAAHVAIGGFCLLGNLLAIYLFERSFWQALLQWWRARHEA